MKNKIKIFVHLRYGFNSKEWQKKYKKGLVADKTPYGYHLAEKYGYNVEFSKDHKESKLFSIIRRGIAKIIGFDVIHAKRNLKEMEKVDVIWTHTEYEYLAILFLLRKLKRKKTPKIICQSIWLFDKWNNFSPIKKFIYKYLIKEADILTFHSDLNLKKAEEIFPSINKQLVYFGISLDSFPVQPIKKINFSNNKKIRILSAGNDIHRDWDTLLKALGNKENIEVKILTYKLNKKKIEHRYNNIKILQPKSLNEIKSLYEWCDIVIIPVKHNLHASGITVLLESITFGKPVIVTKTGGLEAYFSDEEVFYVPPYNPDKISEKIKEIISNPDLAYEKVKKAQNKLIEKEFTTEGFAKRHCIISRDLLSEK